MTWQIWSALSLSAWEEALSRAGPCPGTSKRGPRCEACWCWGWCSRTRRLQMYGGSACPVMGSQWSADQPYRLAPWSWTCWEWMVCPRFGPVRRSARSFGQSGLASPRCFSLRLRVCWARALTGRQAVIVLLSCSMTHRQTLASSFAH